MIALRFLSLSAFLLMPSQSADAPNQTGGKAVFTLDWPAAEVPHWSIEIAEDGTGRYDRVADGAKPSAETKQSLNITLATQERLRAGTKAVAAGDCETKTKHLAQTGAKHIAYTVSGSDAWSSCTFNYSDDKGLMQAVAAFQAIAETMNAGITLQHTHRYDRLGLDAQLDSLTEEAKDGRAIEFQNIAPILQSIIDDERVIDRARRKAARLLQDALPAGTSPR
jgi:hypothetical protein